MRRGHKIRSDLPFNREARPSAKRLNHRNAFGVYRPLTPECAGKVIDKLQNANKEIDLFMAKRNIEQPQLVIPREFAVTYLQRGTTLKALRNGLLRALEIKRLDSQFKSHNSHDKSNPRVRIDNFEWVGGNERKLAGMIAVNGPNQLAEDTDTIGEILCESGADALEPNEPDHLSLCSYRVVRNNYLASKHRREIGRIVGEHFQAKDVKSLELGPLVVGQSYTKPLDVAA